MMEALSMRNALAPTYLDNPSFVDFLLSPYHEKIECNTKSFDYQAYKEEQYDLLADHVRQYVDMEKIYEILQDHD